MRVSWGPKSRGPIRLTGSNPDDPIQIEANTLSHQHDMNAAIACVELCREIGNSAPLRPFVKREVIDRTPFTGRNRPDNANSPVRQKGLRSGNRFSASACSIPKAIGKSKLGPSLRISAGARLIVIRITRQGYSNPWKQLLTLDFEVPQILRE